jgi:hypothetical protein
MSIRVKVPELKFCDFQDLHTRDGEGKVIARYDAKTMGSRWANMCGIHYAMIGVYPLGTGRGQELIYPEGLVEAFEEKEKK